MQLLHDSRSAQFSIFKFPTNMHINICKILWFQVQTKYKLPTLNWIALKPNQVRGTIFNELDDDRLHNYIDFSDFEERFKIGMGSHVANGTNEIDGLQSFPSKRFKKPENVSLLEHTRLRNIGVYNKNLNFLFKKSKDWSFTVLFPFIAISRRKMEMPVEKVIMAVNALDLKILSLENVELLQRMVPTDQEVWLILSFHIEMLIVASTQKFYNVTDKSI